MASVQLILGLLVLSTPIFVQSISVMGPVVIRPHSSYRVALTTGDAPAHSLYVAVEGRRANGELFTQGREIQLQPGSSRIIDLELDDPGPGTYSLVARATSGLQFSSSAPLVYQPRSFCVLIQTDKRVYEPGDTINYRVIALDKYLLPLTGEVEVTLMDAHGTPVRVWARSPLLGGLFTTDLPLSDDPALGEWTIQVEVRGQKYTRQILVADYVQPKFNMEMTMPSQVLFSDKEFKVNISASHFSGLPVKGELTLSAYAVFFSGILQPVFSSPARKVVDFDGQTEVTYNLKTDLDLAEDAVRPLVIEAVLEEKNTLIKQNVSSRIILLRTNYRLKVTAPEYFKPSLPYNIQIEVVDANGEVMDANGQISVERVWDDGAPANTSTVTVSSGRAVYSYVPDKAHANSTLNIVIKYNEVSERVVNVRRSGTADDQYMTLTLLTRDMEVGGELRALIATAKPVSMLHYAILGRGDVLHVNTVELNPAKNSVEVRVRITPHMSPGCVVVAWAEHSPATTARLVLSAAIYAPVRKLLQHQLTVSVGGGGRPGSAVELRVSGGAGAHAALLGGDVRAATNGLAPAAAFGSGLNLRMIEREMESFGGLRHEVFKNEDHQPGLGSDLGGYNAADVFTNAGVVILTNGVLNWDNRPGTTTSSPSILVPETGTRPPLAGPYAFSRLPPPPSPRFYLTGPAPVNTWMMTNFTLGNDGTGSVSRRTPISGGEWSVGAVATHPTLGLGLASTSLTTSTVLTVTADLPASLQKGETLAAVVTVSTTLAQDTTIEITFHNSEQYFEFEPLENDIDSGKRVELFRRVSVQVPARGSRSTAFLVTVIRTGEAPVIVEATGNGVSGSLFRTIDVKDGFSSEIWSWRVVDARRGMARANVTLLPTGVRSSVRLGPTSLRAAGDLLAPALHAARGTSPPAADPAQALKPLALGCLMLNYLQATDREEVAIVDEARAQVALGYQKLVAYRKSNGAFSADQSNDADGDVWMTAMSLRWLSRCARYVAVDNSVTRMASQWLVQEQKPDGSWTEPPRNMRHNQRAQKTVPLTAHALLALQASKGKDSLQRNALNKAIDYIARSISSDLDPYSLALVASALASVSHPHASLALQTLDLYANVTDGMRSWHSSVGQTAKERRDPWLNVAAGSSARAATAAWGLQALLAGNLAEEAMPVANYLVASFTPDNLDPDVLTSLADLAETMKAPTKLRLSVTIPGSEEPRNFNIDDDNALIIQTQLVRNARNATATTEGRGLALVGMSATASSNVTAAWPRYTLDPRVDNVSTAYRLQLSICIGFVAQGNETISGFTLLTVQLPSGYTADINTLTELAGASHISRARLASGGTKVLAWLRPLDRRERCATLAAPRSQPVARQRPGYASLIDLYDTSHRARVFFQPVPTHACDVCRAWDSCSRVCGSAASQRAEPGSAPSRAYARVATFLCYVIAAVHLLL